MKKNEYIIFIEDSDLVEKYLKNLNIKPVVIYDWLLKKDIERSYYSEEDIVQYMNAELIISCTKDDKLEISEIFYTIHDTRTGEKVFESPRKDLIAKELNNLESRRDDETIYSKYSFVGNDMIYPYHPREHCKEYIIDFKNTNEINISLVGNDIYITGVAKTEQISTYKLNINGKDGFIETAPISKNENIKIIIPNVFYYKKGIFSRKNLLFDYLKSI